MRTFYRNISELLIIHEIHTDFEFILKVLIHMSRAMEQKILGPYADNAGLSECASKS